MALLCLLPAMSLIIRHIWFFKGTGKTLEMEAMRQKLFSINAMDCPVQVIKKKRSLIVTWNHSDWKWCDYMSCAGMKTLYELCLHFEPATNTVNISDKIRSVYFIVCPDEVKTGLFSWPRPLLNLYTGEKWTIEKYIDCIPPDFSFTPQEIKSPVLGTLRKHGWNIRFHYF
ncbi:hypothetical protein [Desulfogranum japonicum]|uniref:hypothetical protein n=1 Tax=Desulfogranum japonicum TaxID=231447 RepID=UPI001294660B|nr:hypothetical protein [Desulfogranum japonicum]